MTPAEHLAALQAFADAQPSRPRLTVREQEWADHMEEAAEARAYFRRNGGSDSDSDHASDVAEDARLRGER